MSEVLKGLDLNIKRGERIGLIGSTGSGKSTLVDLLMGLLPPSGGRFLIDGVDLYAPNNSEFLLGWRAAVAHVPQSIYLADSSIAENIAFGVPKSEVDLQRVSEPHSKPRLQALLKAAQRDMTHMSGSEESALVVVNASE